MYPAIARLHGFRGICATSPSPVSEFRLVELVDGGLPGRAYTSPNNEIAVGRDGCDMTYAGDPHLSQRHFKVSLGSVGPIVTDLGSSNGTFIRIKEPMRLRHADYVFIGQQLLRVEIAV